MAIRSFGRWYVLDAVVCTTNMYHVWSCIAHSFTKSVMVEPAPVQANPIIAQSRQPENLSHSVAVMLKKMRITIHTRDL